MAKKTGGAAAPARAVPQQSQPAPAAAVGQRHTAYMPLADVLTAARNPKMHAEEEIASSISRFGLAELPLLDERTGRLVAGHGRLKDIVRRRDAGEEAPEGVQVGPDGTWLIPVNRGWSSRDDAHAEAYLLASNKLSQAGGWDERELATMLQDLAALDYDLATVTGFDMTELEDLIASAEVEVAQAQHAAALVAAEPAEPGTPVLALQAPAGLAIEHEEVPATGARYAETEEEEAARKARIDAWTRHADAGVSEMVLVYPIADREEAGRHVAAAREVLGRDLPTPAVVLRALRVLSAVLDARHDATPVHCSVFARHAGWEE